MYFLTTSLPWNLQVKGGQYFLEFGRQNPQHPHAWAFADQPLVLNRMFGPDGLRSQGLRLSWLVPTSWYTEAMVSVVNSAGGTTSSFRSDESAEIHGGSALERDVKRLGDLLVVPRIATSFDLSDTQTLLVGASAAFGPNNSGPHASTQVFGADLYYKWKSVTAAKGFPFVSFQSEALVRRYGAAARLSVDDPTVSFSAETLRDRGMYSQVLWGIKPMVVAGLRGEFAGGHSAAFESELRTDRYRVSPNLTWYPTEFSKFRPMSFRVLERLQVEQPRTWQSIHTESCLSRPYPWYRLRRRRIQFTLFRLFITPLADNSNETAKAKCRMKCQGI